MTVVRLPLRRKIVAASLSGSAFALMLGLLVPDPFGGQPSTISTFLSAFSLSVPVYLMYSFPVILLFGVPASLLADFLAEHLVRWAGKQGAEPVVSGILHAAFGYVALGYGVAAALLGYTADRMLRRRSTPDWSGTLKSLAVPALIWLLFMFIIYLKELPGDFPALLQTISIRK